MTRRHDIERRRGSLGEIRSIMNSMKTLAYLETRKLGRQVGPQQAVLDHINDCAGELLAACPGLLPSDADSRPGICVVIGSERGFCGDFNRRLAEAALERQRSAPQWHWVLVGHRLLAPWPEAIPPAATLDGASVTEELAAVLDALVAQVGVLRDRSGAGPLEVLSNLPEDDSPHWTPLLPPFQHGARAVAAPTAPALLQLTPPQLLRELIDQYLFAALNARLVHALMAENHQRVMHLERATRHLEAQWEDLGRRSNVLRQEEIIEEIEVILLSAEQSTAATARL